MSRRPPRRYLVRTPDGRELVCPSLTDLHALYAQGFFGDADLVRAEGSPDWVPVGRMAALSGVRQRRRDPRRVALLLAASLALALAVALLLRRR